MHRHLLYNGEIREVGQPLISPGQVGYMNGWGIFSTLRVSRGVLFAFNRHFGRMQRDALCMRVPFTQTSEELHGWLQTLIQANNAADATIRVAVVRNHGGVFEGPKIARDADVIAFTADLANWGAGVKLSYVPHARHGEAPFAGRKVTSWAQNLTLYEEAHDRGFDEVILLNESGQVSECTSANVFAIYGNDIFTPPLATSGCLPGVTRAILLEEIRVPGLRITERELAPSDLEEADQVFITSTTRDLLPVLEVDHEPLRRAGTVLARLRAAFLEYREDFIDKQIRQAETFAA